MVSVVRGREAERGMSLVEVLIALLILGFVALGIASLFSHAQLTNASGYQYAVIASEARRALEEMQALPFNDGLLVDTGGNTVEWDDAARGYTIFYSVEDFGLVNWTSLADFSTTPPTPVDPAAWPAPADINSDGIPDPRLKRITIRVAATSRVFLGRREFVVTTLKIPDSGV
jgi:prepilin-type N-terminal cleavage/methylation domain-containing protein